MTHATKSTHELVEEVLKRQTTLEEKFDKILASQSVGVTPATGNSPKSTGSSSSGSTGPQGFIGEKEPGEQSAIPWGPYDTKELASFSAQSINMNSLIGQFFNVREGGFNPGEDATKFYLTTNPPPAGAVVVWRYTEGNYRGKSEAQPIDTGHPGEDPTGTDHEGR